MAQMLPLHEPFRARDKLDWLYLELAVRLSSDAKVWLENSKHILQLQQQQCQGLGCVTWQWGREVRVDIPSAPAATA